MDMMMSVMGMMDIVMYVDNMQKCCFHYSKDTQSF